MNLLEQKLNVVLIDQKGLTCHKITFNEAHHINSLCFSFLFPPRKGFYKHRNCQNYLLWDSNYLSLINYLRGHTISFQTFFVWAFRIVVDSWQFSMLLLYILWDDWPDPHNWWMSKVQSGTLEVRYAIKFRFKLGKNATETYGLRQTSFRPSCMN